MQTIDWIIDRFVGRSKEILKENLTGIYLHGSAVMGCFNPQKSDIDLIVVVRDAMSDPVKKEYMDMAFLMGPAKGIEMSIVAKDVCDPFVYPTPYELHFSGAHLSWYQDDPDTYVRKMNGTDKDLAAHFTIICKRGRCLYGSQIHEVFARVPEADYMDSIWNDIAGAKEGISDDTMYLTLNLARVLAYRKEGLVLSKKEGGEWALENLSQEYHKLVQGALSEYVEGMAVSYDIELAGRYAVFMLDQIKQ